MPSAYIPIFFHLRLDFYSCSDLLNELKFSILLWIQKFYSGCFWIIIHDVFDSQCSIHRSFPWCWYAFGLYSHIFSAIYLDMFGWVYCLCFGVLNQLKSAIKLVCLRPIFLYFITNVVWNKCCWDLFVFFLLIFLSLIPNLYLVQSKCCFSVFVCLRPIFLILFINLA